MSNKIVKNINVGAYAAPKPKSGRHIMTINFSVEVMEKPDIALETAFITENYGKSLRHIQVNVGPSYNY